MLDADADVELGVGLQNDIRHYEMQEWWVGERKEEESSDRSEGSVQGSILPRYWSRRTPPPQYAARVGAE